MPGPYDEDPYYRADPQEPEITEEEHIHNHNAAKWRAMIKVVANSEIDFIATNKDERTIKLTLNSGRVYVISKIPLKVNIESLAIAFEYMFSKLEAFPMTMEVNEE